MSLAEHYKRQRAWREWPRIFEALPPLPGRIVLDLGCGVGDQAAELAARGAAVIGFDMLEELLREARARGIPGAEFRSADLREPLRVGLEADGVWSSFAAAYFPDLPAALASWTASLRPGGWIALTEIDDMFAHDPLGERTKALLDTYVVDALHAGRYDFRMGRKLEDHLRGAGFEVTTSLDVGDREFAFDGPALPEVIDAWRERFEYMTLLRSHCGSEFERVRDEFLACLARADHVSGSRVRFCLATRPAR